MPAEQRASEQLRGCMCVCCVSESGGVGGGAVWQHGMTSLTSTMESYVGARLREKRIQSKEEKA